MEVQFRALAISNVSYNPEINVNSVTSIETYLDVSENLNREYYINPDGSFTEDGMKALCETLVNGLITSVHLGQSLGVWKDHEQMTYIFEQLQKGFLIEGEIRKREVPLTPIDEMDLFEG